MGDTKHKIQKTHTSANSPKFESDRWPFYNRFWPLFFANYMNIFHKTEIQTVILRCSTSLKLNWYKSYDTKCKNPKKRKRVVFYKIAKKMEMEIFAFCTIAFEPIEIWTCYAHQNDCHEFCESYKYGWPRNGWK